MGFEIYEGEKKISDLVTKMFGELSATKAKRAEAALVDANPELNDLRAMAAGTILVTPTVPGVSPAAPEEEVVIPQLEPVHDALESLLEEMAGAADEERGEIDETAKFLKSAEMKRIVAELPDVTPFLEQAQQGLEQVMKDNDGAELMVKRLKQALKDVEDLSDRLAKL